MSRTITVIPGDGIGPEVTQATLTVLHAAGAKLEFDERLGGVSALERVGNPLPDETLDSIRPPKEEPMERFSPRERTPGDTAACARCGEDKDLMELDRLLWCTGCRFRARERAAWLGWAQGVVFGVLVAAYVFLVVRPTDLVLGGWIATVVAAVWVGSRIGREVAYGVVRYLDTRQGGTPADSPPGGLGS